MIQWLELTSDQKRSTLSDVEYTTGILPKAIEKDWWVTLTLRALFQSAYAEHMVFKGGTSLSKGWKLISRFSEDIDIALSPEAFGMVYKKVPSKGHVDKLKREGCLFTSTRLKEELEKQFAALSLPAGTVKLEADPVPTNRPDTDPQIIHVSYSSLYEPNPYIADQVKIEVSVRSVLAPYSKVSIQSILSEEHRSGKFAEQPLQIDAVEPKKTFLEKVFLLHEEFGKPDTAKIRAERMSRHLYDLNKMIDTDAEKQALADQALYAELLAHRQSYQRISWVKYDSMSPKTINFIPPDEVLDLYRRDYQTMQEQMIYGETASFDEVIKSLKALQERFRRI